MIDEKTRARFWKKVEKSDGCWEWKAYKDRQGYGCFKFQGKSLGAHRFSFEMTFGKIREGLCVCHRCDNPKCVKPAHLFMATNQENVEDMLKKGRSGKKLSQDEAVQVFQMIQSGGFTQYQIAKKFGVSRQSVGRIKNGLDWSHSTGAPMP